MSTVIVIEENTLRDIISDEITKAIKHYTPASSQEAEAFAVINKKDYLTTKEAALFLGLTEQTLCTQRCKKQGPAYIKSGGMILYSKKELQNFLENHRVRTA